MEEWSQDVREQSGECHHTQRVSGVKVVGQFLREIFTGSKELGERHLVFSAFLTTAWRGGSRREGGGRREEGGSEGGMEMEVGR